MARTGSLQFGVLKLRGNLLEYGWGAVDEVRIFQGVVTDVGRVQLARASQLSRTR